MEDAQVAPLRDFLIEMVVPSRRSEVNVIPDHITLLHGIKSKKQLSRKQKSTKSKTLTRRQYDELGLNTLPTRGMKYAEALPLHHLWLGYMREHLNLKEEQDITIPEVHEKRYDGFSKLLVRTDLHGAKVRVTESKCRTLVGLCGIVVMETKNVLKIIGEDNHIRTIPKNVCIFTIIFGNVEFTMFGERAAIRPAERSTKKIKTYMDPIDFN